MISLVDALAMQDPAHQTRQYGIVSLDGAPVTFTGTGAGAGVCGLTGEVGDLVYAIQGNVITGDPVCLDAEAALLQTEGDLTQKIMAAMEAAVCNVVEPGDEVIVGIHGFFGQRKLGE